MKKRTKTLFAIYFAYFLDYFGYAIVFGVFGPLMLSPEFGMFSPETTVRTRNLALASLFAVFPLMQLISAPIFGDLADHFGRKKTFLTLNIGATFGYLLSGLAILSNHFPLLIISRFLTGIFSSNRTICMASLSDLSPDEKSRSNSYGVIATLGGLSWIVSMLVGGFFSSTLNPAIPFWITTAFSCLSLGVVLFFFHETISKKESFIFEPLRGIKNITSCFKIKRLGSLYFFYLFMMMGWGINLLWLNPYTLTRYPISHQTLFILLASTGVVWSFGSSVLNKILLKRYHSQEIAYIGSIGLLIIFILCALMKSFLPFAVCALLASAFGALAWTNALSTISLKAPEDIQGKVMGISQSFGSISLLFAPLLAGGIAGVDIAYVYPMAALLILISIGVLSLATRKSRKPHESKI
ncbi:MAG: MFS transporter [Simkaniaceae bacterium]|nr:MAG: MFS transporter [Simkaniaceae bacterium]